MSDQLWPESMMTPNWFCFSDRVETEQLMIKEVEEKSVILDLESKAGVYDLK